jgi:hypothetical protein
MIETKRDQLVFTFPDVHPDAKVTVTFQRTLRIPDDGRDYPLPPGLGAFPVRHVDDFAARVPALWREHGGVMLPISQAEALWVDFDAHHVADHGVDYPFALKIAAGKINAVDGSDWSLPLAAQGQDWVVVPGQPWLDGFHAGPGLIRQFVAMPLGQGYTAEEQLTGRAEHGGLQIVAMPMKRAEFERRFPKLPPQPARARMAAPQMDMMFACESVAPATMGLAAGGRMKQDIFRDKFGQAVWDQDHQSRCFVHLCDALTWQAVTDQAPPGRLPSAAEYTRHGLPWFDWYDGDRQALADPGRLAALKSVLELAAQKRASPLPENESTALPKTVKLGPGQVREGAF